MLQVVDNAVFWQNVLLYFENDLFTMTAKLFSFRKEVPNKTFNKRKNRALLTLRRSQKHYEIFSNNVLREKITRKQFKKWLGLVSILKKPLDT